MRIRRRFILSGIIIFIFLIILIIFFIITPGSKSVKLNSIDLKNISMNIEDGDIICRLGDRIWSLYFRDVSVTDRRFSHMGILRVNNDLISVIHTEGDTGHGIDYVNETSLEEFIQFARTIGIYRIKDINGSRISDLAAEYLKIPFDWQFDMNDDSKLYCTELLYVILNRLAPQIELNTIYAGLLKKNVIPLDAISDSEYFKEILFLRIE